MVFCYFIASENFKKESFMSRALFFNLTAVRVSILLLIIWVAGEKVMGSPVLLARNCHDILAGGCS
jgi:hypothetical protein